MGFLLSAAKSLGMRTADFANLNKLGPGDRRPRTKEITKIPQNRVMVANSRIFVGNTAVPVGLYFRVYTELVILCRSPLTIFLVHLPFSSGIVIR